MSTTHAHLRRILSLTTETIMHEVLNCSSLSDLYPEIGDLHPAVCREVHIQSLLFAGLRAAGYATFASGLYFTPRTNARQIDLAVWLLDVHRWLFLEIEPCGTQAGYSAVIQDARKLVDDDPTDPRDQLRGLLVYGFRQQVSNRRDDFVQKYEELGAELSNMGFAKVGISQQALQGESYPYVLAGLWTLGLPPEEPN